MCLRCILFNFLQFILGYLIFLSKQKDDRHEIKSSSKLWPETLFRWAYIYTWYKYTQTTLKENFSLQMAKACKGWNLSIPGISFPSWKDQNSLWSMRFATLLYICTTQQHAFQEEMGCIHYLSFFATFLPPNIMIKTQIFVIKGLN